MNFMTPSAAFADTTITAPAVDRSGDHWSEDQVLLLASLIRVERMSTASAAERMGRTESSISTAISRYSVRDPRAQLRTCLGAVCNGRRKFFSMHVGNRMCSRCSQRSYPECA